MKQEYQDMIAFWAGSPVERCASVAEIKVNDAASDVEMRLSLPRQSSIVEMIG